MILFLRRRAVIETKELKKVLSVLKYFLVFVRTTNGRPLEVTEVDEFG